MADRDRDSCARAKCLSEEINSGVALRMHTLKATWMGDRLPLSWAPPFTPEVGPPRRYEVWRRFADHNTFELVGETTGLSWEEPSDDRTAEYLVGAVW